ncbi:N5-glutamine S-adenosyl-L-methionine-dependent methyltransferase [Marmoricola endophyticus]|uniref:peptide chain release factor N(5)-glutamine methyltransferase n=1 Tax=Marmoricola endophyticus TaxID=2040280 RepID=A0A917BDF1_9ACTN|nr:putative protein N(5)-glutamine methyltransferase [Marmoricola endophyticus]GGF34455.1 N5-glutamine S-adenosyl-L-methionine-dependent methyltransferase [Marmoricola endophyticus]
MSSGWPPSAGQQADVVRRLRAAGCVFAEDEAAELVAAADTVDDLARLVRRRVAGEPLEHVVGRVSWAGLELLVGPGVFVPRRRTALLAEVAVAATSEVRDTPVVVDLCCGAGAVAAYVADRLPRARLYASDVAAAAVACARANVGERATVLAGDLYDPLPAALHGRVDVLCVNAPYVPTDALDLLPHEAREHEPLLALDGGADGLDVHRRVLAGAAEWLTRTGTLVVEVGEPQLATYLDLLGRAAMVGEPVRGLDDELVVRATPRQELGHISYQV